MEEIDSGQKAAIEHIIEFKKYGNIKKKTDIMRS